MSSRWAESKEDDARRKQEKDEKRRLKAEKQRKAEREAAQRKELESSQTSEQSKAASVDASNHRPIKRRRLSDDTSKSAGIEQDVSQTPLLRFAAPSWGPCRRVDNFVRLNHIEEGSYGWVSRAQETATGEIVALKKLKMDNSLYEGFPVTALREIQTLRESRHRHIVSMREVVVGSALDEVYLVMDFIEHDLKTLQDDMPEPFLPSEVKTLMQQLCSAVSFLHSHWILHRDIKTSNILLNNKGEIKLADFGMARYTGDPAPPDLTQLVVTLWYRAPELLLGAKSYGFEIDMWSVGCIFGELLQKEPLLQGKNEVDQMSKILPLTGLPTKESYPGFTRLPIARSLRLPPVPNPSMVTPTIRRKFPLLTNAGASLLTSLLSLNPDRRPAATEMLQHPYFKENPRPVASEMFPTFPSRAGMEKRRRKDTPSAPRRGEVAKTKLEFEKADFGELFRGDGRAEGGSGFRLNMG